MAGVFVIRTYLLTCVHTQVDAEVWFGDLANHLSNFEIMQLTLGQAAFTLLFMFIVSVYSHGIPRGCQNKWQKISCSL